MYIKKRRCLKEHIDIKKKKEAENKKETTCHRGTKLLTTEVRMKSMTGKGIGQRTDTEADLLSSVDSMALMQIRTSSMSAMLAITRHGVCMC